MSIPFCSRLAPAAAELQGSCKGAPATIAWHCFTEVRRGHSSSRLRLICVPHTTLTSALSLPRRHHHNPDIAMLPALRRVAPRITKTAVNARALSKGTMDMRGSLLSNPKLGIIRWTTTTLPLRATSTTPARSHVEQHGQKRTPNGHCQAFQRTAHEAPGSLHTLAERPSRSVTSSAWRFGSLCQSRRLDLICLA